MQMIEKELQMNMISKEIIGCAIEVHRTLGPGLLESTYEMCLEYELKAKKLEVKRQLELPVYYKGIKLSSEYRIDLLVEDCVIIEIKSIKELAAIHTAQILSYLKHKGNGIGLLINFNVPVLKDGIKRVSLIPNSC